MVNISLTAPAKINLHLEVLGKREDGYHNLISLYQLVSLMDRLTIRSLKKCGECRIIGTENIPLKENTMWQAVDVFRDITGIDTGFEIRIDKQIPQGAGLGGGSSDAASVLLGINSLSGYPLKKPGLLRAAARIGTDVPLFISAPAGIMTNTGTSITPLKPRCNYSGVIVFPGFSVSTPQAYSSLGRTTDEKPGILFPDTIAAEYSGRCVCGWNFFNSFETPVQYIHPHIADILNEITAAGFCYCRMSGSGSSCFGLNPFESDKPFPDIDGLRRKYAFVSFIEPLAELPEVLI
ncbi:MAG: 4-(cytidine 5'-diphospho)-2-C-methyl-D-erythritol kinase [Spirochaetia bacterium]